VRLQGAQSQQLLAEKILNLSGRKDTLADIPELVEGYERLQSVVSSNDLTRAWEEFRSQLPAMDSLRATAETEQVNFDRLVELCLALTDQLRQQDAPVNQIESANHLHQLAQSVQSKLSSTGSTTSQPLRARGPWLVFEQILNRFEIMLGSDMISDAGVAALVVDTRSEFNGLDRFFRGTLADLNMRDGDLSRSALQEAHARLSTSLANFSTGQTIELQQKNLWFRLGLLSALLSVLMHLALAFALWNYHRRQNSAEFARTRREQASILRLLDEISALADGDLNTKATVSEDHTGAIADSINYAVGELRRLVAAITNSADRVTVAVEETGASAVQLANASSVQSREIQRSATYLGVMSETMEHMTKRSGEASQIASKTVERAVAGKQSVSRVTRKLDATTQQMQQTSMLLKRLVDSCEQIGSVLGMMERASEKTKLLALNSAIQSGSDADSNSRFSLISDEVQDLSNVLRESARQIEVQMGAIQDDARAALISLDHTAAGITEAKGISVETESSLKDIEGISRRLSVVVEHLTSRTGRQSDVVKQLSANMDVINDVTRRSAHGMQLSASALGDLRVMATELRDGVSDFVLPPVHERWSHKNDIVGRPLLKKRESGSQVGSDAGDTKKRDTLAGVKFEPDAGVRDPETR